MEPSYRSPLVDLFRRGEAPREARLLAAQGRLAPRAIDQVALLILLLKDPDPEVSSASAATIDRLPAETLAAFLARPEVTSEIRAFFAARGIEPAAHASTGEDPLVDAEDDAADAGGASDGPEQAWRAISTMTVPEKLKLAMRGTREQRAALVCDSNRLVAAAVLSSPKLTENEIEGFSRMGNVSDEVLRVIGLNRAWTRNMTVVSALVHNPKTPLAVSLTLISRLPVREIKRLSVNRNVPEAVRLQARKMVAAASQRQG